MLCYVMLCYVMLYYLTIVFVLRDGMLCYRILSYSANGNGFWFSLPPPSPPPPPLLPGKSGVLTFNPHDHGGHTQTQHVAFSPPFADVPELTSGLTYIDSANGVSADRIDVEISGLATTGFDMMVKEWLDTHNYGVKVSWMACQA